MGKNDKPKPRQPASECAKCGTWRTPGESHVPNDTNADPGSAIYSGLCQG